MKKTVLAAMAATCLVAFHPTASQAMNCVAYVRSVTAFDLSGNAYQWWSSAAGVYARGRLPQPGAVMVFSRTRGMPDGHVAVVRSVRSPREILVDQANWVRGSHGGAVTRATSVVDVSPNNDWTQVRVEWLRSGSYGRVNPVSGFIYQDGDSRGAILTAQYLKNKSTALAATEPCATPGSTTALGHGSSEPILATPPAHSRIVTATWEPSRGKKAHMTMAVAHTDKHHGRIVQAAMHVGVEKHQAGKSGHVVSAVATHHAQPKLRSAVLLYNEKTKHKVIATESHPAHATKIAAKIVLPAAHAAKTTAKGHQTVATAKQHAPAKSAAHAKVKPAAAHQTAHKTIKTAKAG